MKWEPINERLIIARFYGTAANISIIQGYAPTNDAEPKEKEEFYDTLQSIIDKVPKKDLVIIMGDFNAKIGRDNTGREQVMGRHGEGEINANGELLVNMCAFNSMVIGGSIFPHEKPRKTRSTTSALTRDSGAQSRMYECTEGQMWHQTTT